MLSALLVLAGLALGASGDPAPSLSCELRFDEWCLVGSSQSYELSRDSTGGRRLTLSAAYFRGTTEIRQKSSCQILDLASVSRTTFVPLKADDGSTKFVSTVTWTSEPDCNLHLIVPAIGPALDPVARDALFSSIWLFEAGSNEIMTLSEVSVIG